MIRRGIAKRVELLEHRARTKALAVHRIVFDDDPVPADLPPGSTVHRIVFVTPGGQE